MVDINISVLKDAAEAVDQLVDTIRRIAHLFRDAVKSGSQLVDWNTARLLRNRLAEIHKNTTFLFYEQTGMFYVYTDENGVDWHNFHEHLAMLLRQVQSIKIDLQLDANELSTLPFYKDLLMSLAARERILKTIIKIEHSGMIGSSYINAVDDLTRRYSKLTDELETLNEEIRKFIVRLRHERQYPTEADYAS
jgi:hypothetical protein